MAIIGWISWWRMAWKSPSHGGPFPSSFVITFDALWRYPPNESSQMGWMSSYPIRVIYEMDNKSHVWNHQPVCDAHQSWEIHVFFYHYIVRYPIIIPWLSYYCPLQQLLVGGAMCPSWKMMEFVNGKDDIPYMKWKKKIMFQTTSQLWIKPNNGWNWKNAMFSGFPSFINGSS